MANKNPTSEGDAEYDPGSGIDYRSTAVDRDIQPTARKPGRLTAARQFDTERYGNPWAPDYSQYQQEADPVSAYDSFTEARFPGGVTQATDDRGAIERYGLSVADRASDAKYGGAMSDEFAVYLGTAGAAQGSFTGIDTGMLDQDEVDFYASGGENAWDVTVDEYGLPDTLGGTLRDQLVSNIDANTSTTTQVAWLAIHSPAAMQAIVDQGMNPGDVATVHNVYVAQQAVDRAEQLVNEGTPLAAAQLLNVMPPKQRIIAAALLHARLAGNQRVAEEQQAEYDRQQDAFTAQNQGAVSLDANTTPTSLAPIPSNANGGFGPEVEGGGMEVLNWLLEAVLWGVEKSLQVQRTQMLGLSMATGQQDFAAMTTPATGERQIYDSFAARAGALWQSADRDFISISGLNAVREKYSDDAQVKLGLDMYAAQRSNDPEAMLKFKQSIASDPVSVAAVNAAMYGGNVSGGKLAEIMVDLYAQDQGDWGSVMMKVVPGLNSFDPGTIPFSVGRDTLNVASWFLFDPLVYAGVAGKAFRASKYGLAAIEKYGSKGALIRAERIGPLDETMLLGRVTGFNGVRAEYDEFGAALKAFAEAESDDVAANIVRKANKRWMGKRNSLLNDTDWAVGKKYGLYTAEDWAQYFDDVDRAGQIMAGKQIPVIPARKIDGSLKGKKYLDQFSPAQSQAGYRKAMHEAEADVYEGMSLDLKSVKGQQVRRGVMVPHATWARATFRASAAKWGARVPPAYITRAVESMEKIIATPGFENMTRQERMAIFKDKISNDETFQKALGLEWGDWAIIDGEMQRSVMGRFVDNLFGTSQSSRAVGAAFGFFKKSSGPDGTVYLPVKGWKRDRTLFDPVGRLRGMREQWARLATRLPNLPNGLNVQTAEHADEVYRMAVTAGLGRGGANLIRLAWVEGNAAGRQNIMIGLTRSFTASLGMDAVDPHLASRIMREMTGLRAKEEYAATAIPNEAGVRATIKREVQVANGARREEIAARTRPQQARIDEIREILKGAGNGGKDRSAAQKASDIKVEEYQSFLQADDELQSMYAKLSVAFDEATAMAASSREQWLTEQWIMNALKQGEDKVFNAYMKHLGWTPPPARSKRGSKAWELFEEETPLGGNFRARSSAGVDYEIADPTGLSQFQENAWKARGEVPLAWAKREMDVEEFWSWLHTGNRDAHRLDGFVDEFGYAPKDWSDLEYLAYTNGKSRVKVIKAEWYNHTSEDYAKWATDRIGEYFDQAILIARENPGKFQEFLNETPFIATLRNGVQQLTRKEVKALRREAGDLKESIKRTDRKLLSKIDDQKDFEKAIRVESLPGGRLNLSTAGANPSVDQFGKSSAIYVDQTSDFMKVPNFKAMDQYAARASFLNTFLFQGSAGTNITEGWVLGSLYGPRFALRNAFEDIAMYVLTGGSLGKFWKGRRFDEAIDASLARVNKDFLVAQQRYDKAAKEFNLATRQFDRKQIAENELKVAKDEYEKAKGLLVLKKNEKTLFHAQKYGQSRKRGFIRKQVLAVSERLSWTPNGHERDGVVAAISRLLAPTTSAYARREALEKGPQAMIELAEKAVLRQNVVWNRPGWQKIVPARAEKASDLTPVQLQYLRDEEDFLRSAHGLTYKDMAAETAEHLMDGSVPTLTNGGRYEWGQDGKLIRRISVDAGYKNVLLNNNVLSPYQARGLTARLNFITANYGLNQAAMHQLPNYWRAVNAAGGPQVAKVDDIIETVLGVAQGSRDWAWIAGRFRLADDLGAKEHVRRMMDDMASAFTKRSNDNVDDAASLWNQDLWIALRHEDPATGKVHFSMTRPDGETAVSEVDFMTGQFDTPASVLVHGSEDTIPVPAKDMWSATMWSQMGRSMSRMSRNPIFYSNYLETRQAMRPLERRYSALFGEEYTRRKMTDIAAERAYELTMSFVDNPTIRSNISWQVRNIARYYRAQEDFIRRVMRMAKFDPISVQKANLAWQAQQDFGFVHRDDYGQDYFVYPGSAAVLDAMQVVAQVLRIDDFKVPRAPLNFSGNVQWLSPSLDLGSARPTLSSPIMAISVQAMLREIPVAEDHFKMVENVLFGDVSANMDWTDLNLGDNPIMGVASATYQTTPPIFKKLIAVGEGIVGAEIPGSYGAKIFAKTTMAMASADLLPSQQDIANPEKRKEFKKIMGRRVLEVSFLNMIFGLGAPSSPQLREDTLSISAREEGFTAIAPGLREGINASIANGDSWEMGYITWLKDNPKQAAILVSPSSSVGGAYIEANQRNADFLVANKDLAKENPVGISFWTPDLMGAGTSDEGNAAWRTMKTFGFREYKDLQPFVDQVLMAEGKLQKSMLDLQIEDIEAGLRHYDSSGNITPEWRAHEDEKERAYERLDDRYPSSDQGYLLREEDEIRVQAREIVVTNRELRGSSAFAASAAPLVDAYEQIRFDYDQFLTNGTGGDMGRDEMKTAYKDAWQTAVNKWWARESGNFPPDRAEKMVTIFTRSLNSGWRDITLEGGQ